MSFFFLFFFFPLHAYIYIGLDRGMIEGHKISIAC